MRKQLIILALSLITVGSSLTAQQLYTAHVGTFVDIRPQDFDGIRPLGFIYAQQQKNNLNQVYLGHFTQEAKAQQVVNTLKARGFTNAQVLPVYKDANTEVAVIQIATRYTNRPLNWATLKRAGQLNVIIEDERIKIFTVIFPDINTAKNKLPQIQSLGFADAFVKTVNKARLIPVTSISTGIKEDLIPLNLTETPVQVRRKSATIQPAPAAYKSSDSRIITSNSPSVPRPAGNQRNVLTSRTVAEKTPLNPATTNLAKPIALEVALPAIRGKIKRTSALNLQKIMQQEGYYDSSLDGYYGPGTKKSYRAMLAQDPAVLKYRFLATNTTADNIAADGFFNWPEVQLLYTIAMDINPEARSKTSKLNAAAVRRYQLSLTDKPLSISQLTLLNNWQNSSWANIEKWVGNDPFLIETANALQFAYFQSQVRLEDYYMDKGFEEREAQALALASLQAIVGVAFERF